MSTFVFDEWEDACAPLHCQTAIAKTLVRDDDVLLKQKYQAQSCVNLMLRKRFQCTDLN